jgi:hypothetical protein
MVELDPLAEADAEETAFMEQDIAGADDFNTQTNHQQTNHQQEQFDELDNDVELDDIEPDEEEYTDDIPSHETEYDKVRFNDEDLQTYGHIYGDLSDIAQSMAMVQDARQRAGEPPDSSYDPEGYREWENNALRIQQADTVLQHEMERVTNTMLNDTLPRLEQAFSQKHPDYADAMAFIEGQRAAELKAHGVPQNQIGEQINHEAKNLVLQALVRRENPVAYVYNQAKARGFKGSSKVHQRVNTKSSSRSTSQPRSSGGSLEQILSSSPGTVDRYEQQARKWLQDFYS